MQQQEEKFALVKELDPRVDILWVVDNSASMEPSQEKLRKGFGSFARKYMRPDWDIRTAVITTDTYLAHPAFRPYLDKPVRETKAYESKYLKRKFSNGVTPREMNPTIGPEYARLVPGAHDGPIPGLCFERNFYFYYGRSNCSVRDQSSAERGIENCVNPGEGKTAEAQCVNTVNNDTVHSGKAILSSREGSTDQLIRDFTINASTGAAGNFSERGMGSVLQLLADNERTETSFFRKGSFRMIVFVADEDDQTMVLPAKPEEFDIYDQYKRRCPKKNVGGHQYKLGLCPKEELLVPVASIKQSIDDFFAKLDGRADGAPNYVVVSIVAMEAETIRQLQRKEKELYPRMPIPVSHDQGFRYMKLGELVGNGSLAMDVGLDDYSTILEQIGHAIVERFRVFELKRAPTQQEHMIVTIIHKDGTSTVVPYDKWKIEGTKIIVTDEATVLGFKSGDRISISYQPKTVI
ncbi:MAG TPA: hypothetical protein VM598_08965 [Bdellovibrionota bacterium]|nr:hypothetical protein [Bdellovibrionota bacterium]